MKNNFSMFTIFVRVGGMPAQQEQNTPSDVLKGVCKICKMPGGDQMISMSCLGLELQGADSSS